MVAAYTATSTTEPQAGPKAADPERYRAGSGAENPVNLIAVILLVIRISKRFDLTPRPYHREFGLKPP